MDDRRKNLDNVQAVIAPAEVWHLAQGAAFEAAATMVREALEDDRPAGLDDYSATLSQALADRARESFKTFMHATDHPLSVSNVIAANLDEATNLPMVEWPAAPNSNSWGMLDLEANGVCPAMVLAMPFRPTALDRLPAGTQIIKIDSPYHASTAALVETLQCARRDVDSVFQAGDSRAAWRQLNRLINIYLTASKVGLSYLKDQDFLNWRVQLPSGVQIGAAAGLICSIAATPKAQCGLAVYIMATWLQAMADACEKLPGEERQRTFIKRLHEASQGMEQALDGMNASAARAVAEGMEGFSTMVVMSPVPESLPVLAVIPKPSVDNVARIKPLRKRA